MIHAGGRPDSPKSSVVGQLQSSVLRLLTLSVSNVVDRKQMEANGEDDEEQKKNKVKK